MELDRATIIDSNFKKRVAAGDFPLPKSIAEANALTLEQCWECFRAQCISRHCDLQARKLRAQNKGFYTIGSSGHEGNAAVALAFRTSDPAFLHYRSGAFMAMRSLKANITEQQFCDEQCLALVAAKDDPVSGGRHKVFGSKALNVPPQTSTIASHGPKAFGSAFAVTLAKGYKPNDFFQYERDSVVLCSFGDASFNHSTLQGAINTSLWSSHQSTPMPLVWVCEDNGIGISVPTPQNWVQNCMQYRDGIQYLKADGLNIIDVYSKACQAESLARKGKPVFLHIKTIRLMGHAGSDVEQNYRTLAQIEQVEAQDPLLHTARILHHDYGITLVHILNEYHRLGNIVVNSAQKAANAPGLLTAEDIMQSIIPPRQAKSATKLQPYPNEPMTMAQSINDALKETLTDVPGSVIFGEDVGKKGGVYWVTQGLQKQFGRRRVFDTLLDEQSILGTAIGLAQSGFLPIPEIQFLAYIHNAIDQLRGEAATCSFFSNGQFTNPMVIRIPGFAYQKGFGGHFHNDNAFAFLREIPGIVVCTPSRPKDAGRLFKECVRIAKEELRVVVFIEPIALYHQKDLLVKGDNAFLESHQSEAPTVRTYSSNTLVISYANGMRLSRVAAHLLKTEHQITVDLFDCQWLKPLPAQALLSAMQHKEHIIIVDECRQTGSISEEIVTLMQEHGIKANKVRRITAQDCFIPLGEAWKALLPSCEEIIDTVVQCVHNTSVYPNKECYGRSIPI